MPSHRCVPFVLAALVLAACATADNAEPSAEPDAASSPTLPVPNPRAPDGAEGAKAESGCTTSADCPAPPPCEEAVCEPATSACVMAPLADRTKCDNGFGQCVSGKCEALTSCFGDSPMQYIHCDGTTYRDLSTGLYTTSRVSTYACASGETTNEVALEFDPPAGANVTVTLSVTEANDADLDLIVLEGDCTGAAACAGQSITAATGTESATFTAKPNKTYYVVVDGKVAAPTKFRVAVECL